MPTMNGYEVCERLKASKQLQAIPVIFISALNDNLEKVKAFAAGGVDYITKPFEIEELHARVQTHLKLRRLQIELEDTNERLAKANTVLQDALAYAEWVVEERREIETRFTSLVKNIKDHSIFTMDVDGCITGCNMEGERILGYSEAELMGENFSLIFTPEDLRNGMDEQELRRRANPVEPSMSAGTSAKAARGFGLWVSSRPRMMPPAGTTASRKFCAT